MKKNLKSRRSSKGTPTRDDRLAKTIAERVRMNSDLLNQLALAVTANEKVQRRFSTAIIIRVSRIETMVQMLLGGQIAEAHDCVKSEALEKHAKDAEERISQVSNELGLAMVKFIYGESGETGVRLGRTRQWSDWEI